MIRRQLLKSPETQVLIVLLVAAVLSLIFMQSLVAAPKVLFGRSLSAISPAMFPAIVIGAMAAMCVGALWLTRSGIIAEQSERMGRPEWLRAGTLFGIMVLYALTMVPFGFLISTAIATTLISLQMGARSPVQIVAVALVAPIALYLAATQLLAVSLPELNAVEMAYSRMLSFDFGGAAAPAVSE